jgi:hypothetical protein
MMWQNYHLDNAISKAAEDTKLWQTEKGIVEIEKNTLAIPVIMNDQVKGYIFDGHGKLLLDTIVETKEGAVGKPIEKEIHEPFVMLGNAEMTGRNLKPASSEDLAEAGYADRLGFMAKAEGLLDRFFKNGRIHSCRCSYGEEGLLFAFRNPADDLDILLAEDAKIVYKAMDTVFISDMNRAILKSCEVVCVSSGKSVVVKRAKDRSMVCC